MILKHCGKCNTDKLMKDFSSQKNAYDGKQSWCRKCLNSVNLVRHYEIKNGLRVKPIRSYYKDKDNMFAKEKI